MSVESAANLLFGYIVIPTPYTRNTPDREFQIDDDSLVVEEGAGAAYVEKIVD